MKWWHCKIYENKNQVFNTCVFTNERVDAINMAKRAYFNLPEVVAHAKRGVVKIIDPDVYAEETSVNDFLRGPRDSEEKKK